MPYTEINKYLKEIKKEKDIKLIPSNIKHDVEVLGIKGTYTGIIDTLDADAQPSDVISPKIFYNKDGRQQGTLQAEYETLNGGERKEPVDLTTNSYYVFDYIDSLKVGIISTSTTPTSVYVCRYNEEQHIWDMSSAVTISKCGNNSNIISCKFGGNKTTYDNPNDENIYNIVINGSNGGNYDYHYFKVVRINLDTLAIVRTIDNQSYYRTYWTYGDSAFNLSANPKNGNQFYATLLQSYRSGTSGTLRLTINNTNVSFSDNTSVGLSVNANVQGKYSDDGAYISICNGLTGNTFIYRTSDNAYIRSTSGVNAIYKTGGKYYVFYSYNFHDLNTNTKVTNYDSSMYGTTYTYCYIVKDMLVLFTTTHTYIYWLDGLVPKLVHLYADVLHPTITSWNQQRLGLPVVKSDGIYYTAENNKKIYSITKVTTDRVTKFIKDGAEYIKTLDATATNTDILEGKYAYANNIKVTGAMPNNGTLLFTPKGVSQTIPKGYTDGGTIEAVSSKADINIIPENIRNGVTILGVDGTFEGSTGGDATSDANIQAKYLLEGYKAVSDGELIVGAMRNYGLVDMQYAEEEQVIPTGYYDELYISPISSSALSGYNECLESLINI